MDKHTVDQVRAAIADRAHWLYLIWKEFGEKAEGSLRKAVYKYGLSKAEKMGAIASPQEWAEKLISGPGRFIFEQQLVEKDDAGAVLEFRHCPLVEAWKELGASEKEISYLCDIARTGDFGRADPHNVRITFEKTLGDGHDCCRIVVRKKDEGHGE